MRTPTDDWGGGLGSDPEKKSAPAVRPPKENSRALLVYYFRDRMPEESMNRIGAPINAKALMSCFRKLVERGFTHDDIRAMIDVFAKEITRRPLPVHVAPWRGFIANIDKYAKGAKQDEKETATESTVDPRLLGE
jgi:hypothetical protein